MALRTTQLLLKYGNESLSLGIKRPKRELKTFTPFYCRVEICVEFSYLHTRSQQAACEQGTRCDTNTRDVCCSGVWGLDWLIFGFKFLILFFKDMTLWIN